VKKTVLFVSLIVLSVLAASAFPLFGNSAEEVLDDETLTTLAPVSEQPAVKTAGRSCGGSCCGSSGSPDQAASKTEQIRSYLTDYYVKLVGEDVEVLVKDLGCHHEAEVRRGDEVIARLSINGGVITEIG